MSSASRCAKTRRSSTKSPKARGCMPRLRLREIPRLMSCHSRASGNLQCRQRLAWMPACTGMTKSRSSRVSLRHAQELLPLVAAFEQPAQRLGRILKAVLHVDFGLELSGLHPAGERIDRLGGARQVIEHDEAFHPPALHDQVEIVFRSNREGGG